jgi:hypothetical protein
MDRKILKFSGSDLFFAFQVVMAYFFAIPQVLKMFVDVRGMTITWLLFADVFILLNLWLTMKTHQSTKSRASFQTLFIYANWAVLVTPMVIISFIKCKWTEQDSIVSAIILATATAIITVAVMRKKSLLDPRIRGVLVGLFRMVPHLYLSYVIINAGSSGGMASKTILAANITSSARIWTIISSGRKFGWDKNMKTSLLSEIANEGSWLVVTLVWLLFR